MSKSSREIENKIAEEEQRKDWEDKRHRLQEQKKLQEEEIQEKQEILTKFEEEYSSRLNEKEQEYENKKQELCQELSIKIENWQTFYNEQQEYIEKKRNKQEKKQEQEQIKESKTKLNRLKNIDNILITFKNSKESERLSLQKQIELSLNKQKNSENILQQHGDYFIYEPSKENSKSSLRGIHGKSSSKAKSYQPFIIEFPEDLPSVGKLYSNENQKYLVITYWEEFVQAQKDADRLKAIICVERN